jgi:hypothetical protein
MEDKIDVIQYLEEALSVFDNDPADSEYRDGYQEALLEMYDFFNEG